GQQVPDIREGDTLSPGTPVADVLDLSEMEIIAKVGELDRANLREGQEVQFVLDAVPDKTFHGKIKSMSGTAVSNPFLGDPGKKFDVFFSVDMKELMTGLGAKPADIQRVLATASHNAQKAKAAPPPPAEQGGRPGGPPTGSRPNGPGRESARAGGPPQRGGMAAPGMGAPGGGAPGASAPGMSAPGGAGPGMGAPGGAGPGAGPAGVAPSGPGLLRRFTEADRENAKLPLPPEED